MKVFTLICLILASVIGAGFASGKEVEVYFSRFGVVSFVAIFIAMILFYLCFKTYLKFGNTHKTNNMFETNKLLFKRYHNIINMLFVVCYIIFCAGMIAGTKEIYNMAFGGVLTEILVLATIFACLLETSIGIKAINFINNLFIPITIFFLIYCCVFGFNVRFEHMDRFISVGMFEVIFSMVIYVGINVILISNLLIEEGKKYSLKQIKRAGKISAFILYLLLFIFNLTIILNNYNSAMPMINFVSDNMPNLSGVIIFCIWFCIYSAITSIVFVLIKCINNFIKSKAISGVMVLFTSYLISLIGFTEIIKLLYPIVGVLGVIYTLKVSTHNRCYAKLQKRTKKLH